MVYTMKKTFVIIGICLLLSTLPSINAFSVTKIEKRFEIYESNTTDVPSWAAGNFSGEWGLNIWGFDWFAAGTFSGHYATGFLWDLKLGRFEIEYKENNKENGTLLEGLFFGPYLLGISTDIATGNESHFVGIGGYNETSHEFRWRVMGLYGPTLFMRGTYTEFE